MSQRISEQQIIDTVEFYIRDVDDPDLVRVAQVIAEAQREASDKEWLECLNKLGYGHTTDNID